MAAESRRMKNVWSVSKAKANFADFLRATEKTPQIITVRGVRKAEIRLIPNWNKANVTPRKK